MMKAAEKGSGSQGAPGHPRLKRDALSSVPTQTPNRATSKGTFSSTQCRSNRAAEACASWAIEVLLNDEIGTDTGSSGEISAAPAGAVYGLAPTPESQVRTRLAAGGRWIRTIGPRRGQHFSRPPGSSVRGPPFRERGDRSCRKGEAVPRRATSGLHAFDRHQAAGLYPYRAKRCFCQPDSGDPIQLESSHKTRRWTEQDSNPRSPRAQIEDGLIPALQRRGL
jgi:hypothetical protein